MPKAPQQGVFDVEDPDFTANQLYAQTLGTMHLARIGVGVRNSRRRIPEPFRDRSGRVQQACIDAVLASVGASVAGETASHPPSCTPEPSVAATS